MRLVEGIGSKLLPVAPYLIQHIGVISSLLTAIDEERLHLVNDSLLLLTHSLTQGIRLTSGKACQQTAQQHHLLLINGNTIRILQVFLHHRNIVCNLFLSILTSDERRNIIHWARSVEGVHGYKVLKDRWFQLLQVLLHTCRFKLERTYRKTFLIELICQFVVNGYMIQVYIYAMRLLDNAAGLLQLGEGLQTQEVHLNQTRTLDNMAVVLCDSRLTVWEVGVISCRDRHMIRNRVTTDDKAAGMNTCSSNLSFQLLGIFDGVCFAEIGRELSHLQLRRTGDSILQVHLHAIRQTVGDCLTKGITPIQRQILHTGHILDTVLSGHCAVGDNMGTVLVSVLIHYPLQHLASSIVLEVGIDIRQRDTVGVQETLEQQVVFQRIQLGDSQAISYHTTSGRATSWSYPHIQVLTGRIDKVLHNKEVSRETHRLHDVQLKADAVIHLFIQWLAIYSAGTLVGQLT